MFVGSLLTNIMKHTPSPPPPDTPSVAPPPAQQVGHLGPVGGGGRQQALSLCDDRFTTPLCTAGYVRGGSFTPFTR